MSISVVVISVTVVTATQQPFIQVLPPGNLRYLPLPQSMAGRKTNQLVTRSRSECTEVCGEECDQIPNNHTEIPTLDVAFHHSHLRPIAQEIPPLDSDAEILILLGRDIIQQPLGSTYEESIPLIPKGEGTGHSVFSCTTNDHKIAPSVEDTRFLQIMDKESGQLQQLGCSPTLLWAQTKSDLNNSLVGVLMRFRKEPVAITADILHMFRCFLVREDHRDYLRFLWYNNNDLDSEIVDHKMRVHVFGNSPSPAVAIYGLWRAVKEHEESFGSDTRELVPDITVPRLELCAAVLAVKIAEMIVEEMNMNFDYIWYYTDSKIVLGYLYNKTQRFYIYVNNRIHRIHRSSSSSQWSAQLLAFAVLLLAVIKQHCITAGAPFWIEGELPVFVVRPHALNRDAHTVTVRNGLLRVAGRITRSGLEPCEGNPVIIPGTHHVAMLIVRYYHEAVKHQGRHFTEGAVKAAGFWLVGGKKCIRSLLFKCVTCKKLRGKTEHQQMSELLVERLTVAPPFTYVGFDVFGPWEVTACRTRGGQANSKRRFFAIRGPAKQLHSDSGMNFVGASRELKIDESSVSSEDVQKNLREQHCTWKFNPPHASHMGGHWERMIGIARRILDCMLLSEKFSRLTHKVLMTFIVEVTAVMNSQPLIPVSSDPEFPFILTPATVLTQKTGATPPQPGDFGSNELLKKEWKQNTGPLMNDHTIRCNLPIELINPPLKRALVPKSSPERAPDSKSSRERDSVPKLGPERGSVPMTSPERASDNHFQPREERATDPDFSPERLLFPRPAWRELQFLSLAQRRVEAKAKEATSPWLPAQPWHPELHVQPWLPELPALEASPSVDKPVLRDLQALQRRV
ncbi:2-succinyl-5-enolpyruvyl-6-hydroxy-3-cyclohexene-1-carboxylate synthase [Labeo rohita]|uniref:2-succinyl-5-enolpyruvyl-6-hydroxy-3-cyclohexene-1-carboxylate synthase n=1 Tax=Labeo rohita TaxID=84645 RepID=A0ABQ8LYY9_LABRO|nr:2-succinyl-5-enolpyruvyl-6-hydroxy-3-cyclohexene-1-carboxylate synthase [Labeo rohita]